MISSDPEIEEHRRTARLLEESRARFLAEPFTLAAAVKWYEERRAILAQAPLNYGECGCRGKRPGEPVCRCAMKNVAAIEGRWFSFPAYHHQMAIFDLGPIGQTT